MSAAKKELMEGFIVGDRYQITGLLRKNAHKNVYICKDLNDDQRSFVLKTLNSFDPSVEIPGVWSREISLLHRLRHPHLIPIEDFGMIDEPAALYFIEERVEGRDLVRGTEGVDHPLIRNHCREHIKAFRNN